MHIVFSATPPALGTDLAFPIVKNGLEHAALGTLDADARRIVAAAARSGRFEGEAGSVAEVFVAAGEGVFAFSFPPL